MQMLKTLLPGLQLFMLVAAVLSDNINNNDTLQAKSVPQTCKDSSTSAQTTLQPIVERVFSRRRRFLLLPKGGALKFTVSLSKRLLAMYPRGFNLGIEAAVYFPAFTTRMDLLPKRFRAPTTTTPKPLGPTQPLLIYIPGSELRYKAKPAPKPSKLQRIDAFPVQFFDSDRKHSDAPQRWMKYAKYANTGEGYKHNYFGPTAQEPQTNSHAFGPSANRPSWMTSEKWWQPSSGQYAKWPKRPRRAFESAADAAELDAELLSYRRVEFPDLEPYEENWRHFHGHRDRRQLFHGFEGLSKILGVDMKSCILRTICECKRVLLPPGHSMMHDMLRVVFTVPTTHGLSDDYSQTMRSDYQSCEEEFRAKCPVSLIKMFLSPIK